MLTLLSGQWFGDSVGDNVSTLVAAARTVPLQIDETALLEKLCTELLEFFRSELRPLKHDKISDATA